MFKQRAKLKYYQLGAVFMMGLLDASSASAQTTDNNFSKIAENIVGSIASLPGLLTALAYLFGLLLAVLGTLKIKDHVENPTQTPLKDGAIRLAAGGALFALPIVLESMLNTIGDEGTAVEAAKLKKVEINLF